MRMWSKGLGKIEIIMNPEKCMVKSDKETSEVFVYGNITDPVSWEFKGTLTPEDIYGILKLAISWPMFLLVVRGIPGAIKRFINNLFKKEKINKTEMINKIEKAHNNMRSGSQRRKLDQIKD